MPNTFKNNALANVGTTITNVYTAPAGAATTIIGLTIANTTANSVYVDVILTIGATDYYIIKNALVPTGGALVPIGGDQKVVVEATESIKVRSSAASSVDVVLSILEIT